MTTLEHKALHQIEVCLDEAHQASYQWTWSKTLRAELDLPGNAVLKSWVEDELKKVQAKITAAESWLSAIKDKDPS